MKTRLVLVAAFVAPVTAFAQPAEPTPAPADPNAQAQPLDEAKIRELVDREMARVLNERAAKEASERAAKEQAETAAPSAAGQPSDLSGSSGFFDTRLAFTLTNENLLVEPGETPLGLIDRVRLAEDADQAAQLDERLVRRLADCFEVHASVRRIVEHRLGGARLQRDDGDGVRDHVVQFAAYPESVYPYAAGSGQEAPQQSEDAPLHFDDDTYANVDPSNPLIDPVIGMAWAAAATTSLEVGSNILVLPQRNPVVLAKALATLDSFAGGRVLLGVGVGWAKEEFDATGADFARRGKAADEAMNLSTGVLPVSEKGIVSSVTSAACPA